MSNPFGRVSSWSSRRPAIVIPAALVIMAGLAAGLGQAEEGRISELFVPDTLDALATFHEIEDIWGKEEVAFFLYLADDPTDASLIRAIHADQARLAELDKVTTAGLPDLLERMIGDLDDASDAQITAAAKQAAAQGMSEGFATEDALLVRIIMEPPINIVSMTAALETTASESTANADLRAAGFLFVERMQNEDAGADVGILMPLSLVVVVVVLGALFRRVQDVVIPIFTTLVAIAMAYGTIAWAGQPLAPPSFIVMPLLLGLGIDYMLHIIYVYRDQDPKADIGERFTQTGHHIGYPVFFTAITTLIGFGSFLASSLPQIRIWGLLIGTGALYAFLLGFTLMPALYRLTKRKKKAPRQPLARLMEPVARFVPKRPVTVIVGIVVITGLLGVSATFIEVTPDIEFKLDEDEPPMVDMAAVEDRFGGQTFAMFLIPSGDRDALDAFEEDVAAVDGVTYIDGPIHRLERNGDPDGDLVGPATEGVATEDWWRIIAGYDIDEGGTVLDDLEAIEASTPLDARLTGQDRIQRESDAQFLPNISASTLIALSLVIIVLLAVFRHIGLGILAFVPLLVTMVWQLGIQALAGIPLNPITAIMTAMMIGVGVDFAIHVMSHYRSGRAQRLNPAEAAGDAIRSVGKPVLAATLTTVFAFSVLGFSSLVPLRDFGRVAAIVVACAFFVSLTLLPAMLTLVGRDAARNPKHLLRYQGQRDARDYDRFTVRPRFQDPEVQEWFEQNRGASDK